MPTSRLALKLTSLSGKTTNNPRRLSSSHVSNTSGIKLAAGMTVRRFCRGSRRQRSCSTSAVHAYKDFAQACLRDTDHCQHGSAGILWLIRLYSPKKHHDKLTGTSYKVIRQLGRMGDYDMAERAAKALKEGR